MLHAFLLGLEDEAQIKAGPLTRVFELRTNPFKESRVLITGVTGFAGPHLARSLVEDGAEVYGLVRRRSDGNLRRGLQDVGIQDQVKTLEGSMEDLTSLLTALDKSMPDYVFHLAAQSFVERSFDNPLETFQTNATGTTNLLEALRLKDKIDARFVFAGSSEEYGLVIMSKKQLTDYGKNKGCVFPWPKRIPELPVAETNPLRPMSPYAVTKVYGEHITLNFQRSYSLNGLVTRSFNHEGARRGSMFVTSVISRQVVQLRYGEIDSITVGNVGAFRDWSHIDDIVDGYKLAAAKGAKGDVYNLGSERTNSVLTYLLWALEESGFEINNLITHNGGTKIIKPAEVVLLRKFDKEFVSSRVDKMLLNEEVSFGLGDRGLEIATNKGIVKVNFDERRFRPAEVPVLLSDTTKAKNKIGFLPSHSVNDIIKDQLNYFAVPERRGLTQRNRPR